ncbi:MAG TPA: hypothetical protein VFT69_18935, partial [Pseudolabrys sp.]|nr:hypothetical protein [Pseudolabrys sp.]
VTRINVSKAVTCTSPLRTALLRHIPRQKCRVMDCERDACRAVPLAPTVVLKFHTAYAAVHVRSPLAAALGA